MPLCYADNLGIKPDELTSLRVHKIKAQKKRNPNVVFLSKAELQDFRDIGLSNEVERRMHDHFVLN